MPKCRQAMADALARLVSQKPLAELDRSKRAELNFLRTLDGDVDDEEPYEQLAADLPEEAGDVTVHRGSAPTTSAPASSVPPSQARSVSPDGGDPKRSSLGYGRRVRPDLARVASQP